jgi:hypothetical protein
MIDLLGKALPLSPTAVNGILNASDLGLPELWAVLSVETSGCGYLPDKRPKILFERHVFSRLTGHRFDADDPDISQPTAGGYGAAGAHQYDRLNAAMQLDETSALMSASWGLGQVMGENCAAAGFPNPTAMVSNMTASEDNQLQAMVTFMTGMQLMAPLRAHDWAGFARRYNGPNYAANNYDGLLGHFYDRYAQGPAPDLTIRQIQVLLMYKGFLPGGIDGLLGTTTRTAISAFQASVGMPTTGEPDDGLRDALMA